MTFSPLLGKLDRTSSKLSVALGATLDKYSASPVVSDPACAKMSLSSMGGDQWFKGDAEGCSGSVFGRVYVTCKKDGQCPGGR